MYGCNTTESVTSFFNFDIFSNHLSSVGVGERFSGRLARQFGLRPCAFHSAHKHIIVIIIISEWLFQ